MASPAQAASGAAGNTAAGASVPYINIGTDFCPPARQALDLRDALADSYHEAAQPYLHQRLMECGQTVSTSPGWKYRCGLWMCPLCYQRRALDKVRRARAMDEALKGSGLRSQMLTISVPDSDASGLAVLYNRLSKAFGKIYSAKPYKKRIAGAARCVETSVSDTGAFHVHVHADFLYREGDGPEVILPVAQRCFPDAMLHFSEPLDGVNIGRFAGYVLKLPSGISAVEEWLAVRRMMRGKVPLSFAGVLREVHRHRCTRHPAAFFRRKTQ